MTRILAIAALLFLAGCGQQDQAAAPSSKEANEAPAPKAAVPSLKGDWRVTAVTGKPSGGSMTVAVGDGQASLSIGCLRRAWSYKQDRNTVAFSSSPAGSTNCGRSPSADEEIAFGALGDANLAIFGENDVTLSGPGGTLALERR